MPPKIDRTLITNCHDDSRRQAILRALVGLADELDIDLIAEGVETREEALWLGRHGLPQQQGFFHARPSLEKLAPDLEPSLAALRQAL